MKKNQNNGEAIKELLNPTKKTNDRLWNKKNLEDLKLIEERKKRNKEQKEIEHEILHKNDKYKLDQFKNIPSKLKENTKNWITNEKSKLKPIQKNNQLNKNKSQSKPMTSITTKKPKNLGENIYNIGNKGPQSMFEKYYANKLRSKSPVTRPFEINNNYDINSNNENIYNEDNKELNTDINNVNINMNKNIDNLNTDNNNPDGKANVENLIKEYKEKYGEDEELDKMINDYNNNLNLINSEKVQDNNNNKNNINKNDLKKINNKNLNINPKINNSRKKDIHKAPTPTVNDAPIILPKIHKNYIRENIQLVMDNKVPNKNKINEEKNNKKHKDYGKVPDYIKKYELEREQKKEEKKKLEEASKYPKGTKLLSEEERITTLNGLINSKKEMINILERMPITTRTLTIQNKKEELIKKIEEVEKAIDMFSKKQVFIKA